MNKFIPFGEADFADKSTLISYFNEEQLDELLNFAVALLALPKRNLSKVTLSDIGKTGLLLEVVDNKIKQTHFLPFSQTIQHRDDFQDQYILLVQQSAKILGKTSIELKKRQFILLEKIHVTPNMVRLVLQSEQDLSHLPAGYAFLLKTEILGQKTQRAVRYYTLRKAWQELDPQGKIQNLAWIDVYCHGEKNGEIGLGEQWVKSLKIGDKVTSEREFPEKIDHLILESGLESGLKFSLERSSQALLIADETALPTVARLLELWQQARQKTAPLVIIFLQNEAERGYLEAVIKASFNTGFAKNSPKLLAIIADKNQTPHQQIFATLFQFLSQNPTQINSVWGGLEATTTKTLRPILMDYLNLTRENMVLKVYWRGS